MTPQERAREEIRRAIEAEMREVDLDGTIVASTRAVDRILRMRLVIEGGEAHRLLDVRRTDIDDDGHVWHLVTEYDWDSKE